MDYQSLRSKKKGRRASPRKKVNKECSFVEDFYNFIFMWIVDGRKENYQ